MTDLERFKEQLGNELLAAARRKGDAAPINYAPSRRKLVPAAAAAACLLVFVAFALVPFFRPTSVDAETFEITTSDQVTHLEIVDLITDPEVSEQQLRREVGIESDFIALPTDAELVGHIVAIGTTSSIQPDMDGDERGFISSIELPAHPDGLLTVMYGRPAEPGESYEANVTHGLCRDLFGQTLDDALADLRTIRPTVVARIDLPNQRRDLTDLSLIPDDYLITMVHTISDDRVRVWLRPAPLTAAHLDQGCRR